jgi:hypothetical protein
MGDSGGTVEVVVAYRAACADYCGSPMPVGVREHCVWVRGGV